MAFEKAFVTDPVPAFALSNSPALILMENQTVNREKLSV